MLLPVVFLPLAAVLIQDVKTETHGGAVTIAVSTSQPLGRGDVRVVPAGPGRLYLYLDKSVAGQRSFGDGPDTVLVHRRTHYTKLEIPAPGQCGEPVSVERTATGIRVRPTCEPTRPSVEQPTRREHQNPIAVPMHEDRGGSTERPRPVVPRAARTRTKMDSASLRAALALPPEVVLAQTAAEGNAGESDPRTADAPSSRPAGSKPVPVAVPQMKAPVVEAAIEPTAALAVPAKPIAAPAAQPDAPSAAVANVEASPVSAPGRTGEGSTSFTASTLLAVALLLGLGVGATLYARRHVKRNRMIRIVETASIGPRRSLVVAAIGGRTMVLGVSEAGVALLDTQGVSAPEAPPAPAATSMSKEAAFGLRELLSRAPAAEERKSDTDRHESSLLGRLFQGPKHPSLAARRSREFEELLEESVEDQELRKRLALGESGRVA